MKGSRYDPSKHTPTQKPPSRIAVLISTFIASFTAISVVAALTFNAQWFVDRNVPVIAGSFGASAVLMYGAIESPLSQPRNVIIGHLMSSLIGVSLFKLFNMLSAATFVKLHWLLCSLAVSVSLFCMQVTHTVHPPASATALIAVTGGQTIYDLGYWFVLSPIALGIAIMMVVALLANNVVRRYPTHWWSPKSRAIAVVDQDESTTIADFVSAEDDEEQSTEDGNASDEQPTSGNQTAVHSRSSTVKDILSVSNTHTPRQSMSHHSMGQYAIYYGGDRNEELKHGEIMVSGQHQGDSPNSLETGDKSRRSSVLIEMRGSPHLSRRTSRHPSAIEAEYKSTIERLELRIRELESQIASSSN
ncbi:hypothetical protein BGZ98_001532 [Dissophora globulifera]|nr:hypothetical protein BGZ98_001532 [Dissophora globulifera]